jgi:hypothetical protein
MKKKRIEINLQPEGNCHLAEYLVIPADNFV